MPIDTIDAAILAHRAWVGGFKATCKGINTETFDLAKARDSTGCILGRWLASASAQHHLEAASHEEISSLHRRFHEIAGTIAERLNHGQMEHDTHLLIEQFDDLSKELIKALRLSRQKP